MAPISVVLVDDHEIVRKGLADLLQLDNTITVVGEAGSAREALDVIPRARPDVAIVDVRLPDDSGLVVCDRVRRLSPGTQVIMLSSFSDPELQARAIQAGAAGYLLKEIRTSQILDAVRQVAGGEPLFDAATKRRILQQVHSPDSPKQRYATLTNQERQVLARVGAGMSNRQIGEELHLAEKTVKNYLSSVMAKLGVERRTQAAVMYSRGDFGDPKDLV
ncbi:MAG: response regulator transcription factor [Actinobacteria bacterium]|nr:response regulator transcription factor [Actinomycetota bacterium]